jgi:hypothetical protein
MQTKSYLPSIVGQLVLNVAASVLYDLMKANTDATWGVRALIISAFASGQAAVIWHFYKAAKTNTEFRLHNELTDKLRQVEEGARVVRDALERQVSDLEVQLADASKKLMQQQIERCELQHRFVHKARDLFVQSLGKKFICQPSSQRKDFVAAPYKAEVKELLDTIARYFSTVVPAGIQVFTALRERRADGKFHTFARGGIYRADREDGSQPFADDTPMVADLVRAYNDKQDCVILTGPTFSNWKAMPNDFHEEDRSVLMGAVFCKTYDEAISKFPREERSLEWILCVASNGAGALQKESHSAMMKSFTDVLALLLNSFIRISSLKPPSSVLKQDRSKSAH